MNPERPPSSSAPGRRQRDRLHPVEQSVRWLSAALDRFELPCVVLRGDRELPYLPATSDLTFACAPRHAARFERLLQRAAERYGVRIVARHRAGCVRRFQLHGVDTRRRHRLTQLDLHTAEACHGVPYLSAHQLLQGRTRRRGYARPDVVVSALVDFLGPYLSGSNVHPERLSRVATVLEQWPAQTRDLLGDIFGTHVANELAEGLRSAARSRLFRSAGRARRAALLRSFGSAPMASLGHVLASVFATRIRPLFEPRGKVVAVLGSEGTGNDALIEALRRELGPAFRAGAGSVMKLRARVLSQRVDDGADDASRRRGPASAPRTVLIAARDTFDQALGWLIKITPRRRRNSLVLLDHSVDDLLVDPGRFGVLPGVALVRWLARLAPRPDVTLICTPGANAVRSREPAETLRLLTACGALAERRADVHLVEVGGSPERAVDLALSAIFDAPAPEVRVGRSAITKPRPERRRAVA